MKKLKYIMMAAVCCLATGCHDGEDIGFDDGWQEPLQSESPYGNNSIEETNVVTIKQLKEMYKEEVTTSYQYAKVEEPLQIKGYVTGNDISGNIYNEVVIQDDSNSAIIIAVSQGGIFGYLPVGTEILVELKDLYVGNYGLQPEIGVPYTSTSTGKTYISRMNRFLWNEHFKITGRTKTILPELFADGDVSGSTTWNLDEDGGKLGTIKNVTFKYNNENSVYANPDGGKSVSWYFKGFSSDIMVYTSPYCDFANKPLPQGKVNITGIIKRYNKKWEIIIRSEDDVEEVE